MLTTPVVRCLKLQAGVEVHYLTKAAFATLLEPNPYIDRVWTIQKRVTEVLDDLRREGFAAVVDLHHNLRSWRLRLGLGVPTYAFSKLNLEKWLLVRFKVDRLPPVHIVDRYLAAAAPLGIRNDGHGLDFFIRPEDEVAPRSILGSEPGAFGVFAIGGAHATKRLPPDRIRALCARLDRRVVLLGGPDDREVGAFASQAGPHVFDQCGRLSIGQSASLIRQSGWVISHDTGMMHIAAAFRKPIVSVWGNTVPAFGMYPYLPDGEPPGHQVEVKGLSCRPCSKIGYEACPKSHFRCMRDIGLDEILSALPPP